MSVSALLKQRKTVEDVEYQIPSGSWLWFCATCERENNVIKLECVYVWMYVYADNILLADRHLNLGYNGNLRRNI